MGVGWLGWFCVGAGRASQEKPMNRCRVAFGHIRSNEKPTTRWRVTSGHIRWHQVTSGLSFVLDCSRLLICRLLSFDLLCSRLLSFAFVCPVCSHLLSLALLCSRLLSLALVCWQLLSFAFLCFRNKTSLFDLRVWNKQWSQLVLTYIYGKQIQTKWPDDG